MKMAPNPRGKGPAPRLQSNRLQQPGAAAARHGKSFNWKAWARSRKEEKEEKEKRNAEEASRQTDGQLK